MGIAGSHRSVSNGTRERLGCSDMIDGIGGFTGAVVHERSGLLAGEVHRISI